MYRPRVTGVWPHSSTKKFNMTNVEQVANTVMSV